MAVVDPSNLATRGMFMSGDVVSGASTVETSFAHGLDRVPTEVMVSITDTQDHTDILIAQGTHTSTNVLITATFSGGTGVLGLNILAV